MYGKGSLLEVIRPYKVRPAPDHPPARWETGTRSHEALGLTACIDYIASLADGEGPRAGDGRDPGDAEHEANLARLFMDGVGQRDGVMLYGIIDAARIDERTSTFALRFDREAPLASATRLGEDTGGAVRIDFCHYHTSDEVQRVLDSVPA